MPPCAASYQCDVTGRSKLLRQMQQLCHVGWVIQLGEPVTILLPQTVHLQVQPPADSLQLVEVIVNDPDVMGPDSLHTHGKTVDGFGRLAVGSGSSCSEARF